MATSYQSPGVYIEEVDRGPRPISGVATAVAAFVGFTKRAGKTEGSNDLLNKPQLITNWSQFVDLFGGFTPDAYLPDAVYGYFSNGGSRCWVVSVHVTEKEGPTAAELKLNNANNAATLRFLAKLPGIEGNDIEVSVTHVPPVTTDAGAEPKDSGLFGLKISKGSITESYPSVSVETVEKETAASSLVTVQVNKIPGSLTDRRPQQEAGRKLSDGKMTTSAVLVRDKVEGQIKGDITKREGLEGLSAIDEITMVAVPDLMMAYQKDAIGLETVQGIQQMVLDHCANLKYRFAVLDAPTPPNKRMNAQDVRQWREKGAGNFDSKCGAVYYPWVKTGGPSSTDGKPREVPPCGHIAGIYARVDGERGVHKAPANEVVRDAIGLEINVTKGEQSVLNPKGVNCIRSFPGRGIRVWGGRTLSSESNWQYINVRRLFNYVEASIEADIQWVVFEPNNQDLWARVARDLRAFLRGVWRSGALFGRTPEEAFYVKVDEENNPKESRDRGILNIEIGMAPTKPAEFVVITFTQWAGPNAED